MWSAGDGNRSGSRVKKPRTLLQGARVDARSVGAPQGAKRPHSWTENPRQWRQCEGYIPGGVHPLGPLRVLSHLGPRPQAARNVSSDFAGTADLQSIACVGHIDRCLEQSVATRDTPECEDVATMTTSRSDTDPNPTGSGRVR